MSFCEILGFVIVINIRIHWGKSLSNGARSEVSQESESRLALRGGLPLRRGSGGLRMVVLGVLKVTFVGLTFWGEVEEGRSCIGDGEADRVLVGIGNVFMRVGGGLGSRRLDDGAGLGVAEACVGTIGAVVFAGRPGPRFCWFDGGMGA